MEIAAAVGDEILQISNLRTVNARGVGLREDAVPHREPDAAGCGVRSPNSFLCASPPLRRHPGPAEGATGGRCARAHIASGFESWTLDVPFGGPTVQESQS